MPSAPTRQAYLKTQPYRVIAVGVFISFILAGGSWLVGTKTGLNVEPVISTFILMSGVIGTVIAASKMRDTESNQTEASERAELSAGRSSKMRDTESNQIEREIEEILAGNPDALAKRGFLDGMSVFDESKPSYESLVGLYALVHDPHEVQEHTALEKQREVAEDVISNELEEQNKSELRVLDVGCGTGRLVKVLEQKEEIDEVVGLDVSKGMKTAAENHTRVRSKIVQDDIRSPTEIEQGDFDIVFMFRTFTYMYEDEDIRQALESIFNLLRRGGLLVFDCVNKNELWGNSQIPEDRNYSLSKPSNLGSISGAPNIKVDYEGRYISEDFDEGKYIYESYYYITPLSSEGRSQAEFKITEKEKLRALSRSEVKDRMIPGLDIEENQPDFNPHDSPSAMNFINFVRKV